MSFCWWVFNNKKSSVSRREGYYMRLNTCWSLLEFDLQFLGRGFEWSERVWRFWWSTFLQIARERSSEDFSTQTSLSKSHPNPWTCSWSLHIFLIYLFYISLVLFHVQIKEKYETRTRKIDLKILISFVNKRGETIFLARKK